ADGPGAVVRIWSANPAGTLRIYLDGEDTPVLEAPMTDLLGGGTGGFPGPLAGEYSRGWNLYFPFPYANHCKITSDAGKFYYHVNYRTYPAGTEVASFTASQLTTLAGRIDKLAAELATPGAPPAQTAGEQHPFEFKLAPGETTRWRIAGPKAITEITARFEADDPTTALRAVLLEITFDGNRTVTAPLGDFFGSAPGLNEFATLPLAMTAAGGLRSNWFMPFRETAEIHLVNTGKEAVALTGNLRLTDHQWRPFSMYFHAKWRAQWDVPTRPMIDWNYLTATGKGVFAGVSFAIDNPVKEWWGEGDEKIYVDGEGFPSHFGTGTEDYYGYAWCWPGLFTHAYHSQSRCDGPGNYGRTSVNRFHIIDRIPFTRDFRFDMELWHWHQQCKVNMAVTAYWYAQPGATDGFTAPAAADLTVRPMPEWVVPHVAGALEGETLRITRVTGAADPQDWDNTSAGRHLWWHAGMKPGDSLNLAFPAPADGTYRVLGRFLSAPDYGIHQLAVNGQPAGQPIDFYRGEVTVGDEIDLGVFNLRVGDNEFSATITGANPKAVKAWMFGLDYLMLKPAP
ncbi:MAG: DUF2961 domain-containing protein, partial [Akkermansiaceae bacterium]|nr:DUF2961 domain-containing protein [Akkermansiaceae bacterium]